MENNFLEQLSYINYLKDNEIKITNKDRYYGWFIDRKNKRIKR